MHNFDIKVSVSCCTYFYLFTVAAAVTCTACIAASDPATCPAQVYKGPAADTTSPPTQKRMALALIQ